MEKFEKKDQCLSSEELNVNNFNDIDFVNSSVWEDQFYEASLLAWYAYKTFPGQEMMEAAILAEKNSIPYFLLDQNIHNTHNEIKDLKTDWNRVVIKKRDLKMITKLLKIQSKIGENAKLLCIVGRAHLYGLYSYFEVLQKLKSSSNGPALVLWEG